MTDVGRRACTAYELLTGARPFNGLSDKLARRFAPPSSLVLGLPPALDAFMARALYPDSGRRFHSAEELLAAFEAALDARTADSHTSKG